MLLLLLFRQAKKGQTQGGGDKERVMRKCPQREIVSSYLIFFFLSIFSFTCVSIYEYFNQEKNKIINL